MASKIHGTGTERNDRATDQYLTLCHGLAGGADVQALHEAVDRVTCTPCQKVIGKALGEMFTGNLWRTLEDQDVYARQTAALQTERVVRAKAELKRQAIKAVQTLKWALENAERELARIDDGLGHNFTGADSIANTIAQAPINAANNLDARGLYTAAVLFNDAMEQAMHPGRER